MIHGSYGRNNRPGAKSEVDSPRAVDQHLDSNCYVGKKDILVKRKLIAQERSISI